MLTEALFLMGAPCGSHTTPAFQGFSCQVAQSLSGLRPGVEVGGTLSETLGFGLRGCQAPISVVSFSRALSKSFPQPPQPPLSSQMEMTPTSGWLSLTQGPLAGWLRAPGLSRISEEEEWGIKGTERLRKLPGRENPRHRGLKW